MYVNGISMYGIDPVWALSTRDLKNTYHAGTYLDYLTWSTQRTFCLHVWLPTTTGY